jgi:hypothetical protein
VPTSSDARIEELCARIRTLCCGRFSPETEAELRKLARELRITINEHVQMAKSSLSKKKDAIVKRDPDEE